MELGIREWMIIIGVLLLIAVLLDGIRRMRDERRNHIRVAFKMGGGVSDSDSYADPVDREVSQPRVVPKAKSKGSKKKAKSAKHESAAVESSASVKPANKISPTLPSKKSRMGDERIEPSIGSLANPLAEYEAEVASRDAVTDMVGTALSTEAVNSDRHDERTEANIEDFQAAAVKAEQGKIEQSSKSSGMSDDDVVAVYVFSRDQAGFNGADLLQVLLACDLRFGRGHIFHRHEYKNGTGPVQFSMANLLEPGTFDLNTIETFQTPGVCFFMSLPRPEDPLKAFDYMVETANCIVRNLNGELKDEANSAMTTQTLAHHRHRVEEFERRQLTMTV